MDDYPVSQNLIRSKTPSKCRVRSGGVERVGVEIGGNVAGRFVPVIVKGHSTMTTVYEWVWGMQMEDRRTLKSKQI